MEYMPAISTFDTAPPMWLLQDQMISFKGRWGDAYDNYNITWGQWDGNFGIIFYPLCHYSLRNAVIACHKQATINKGLYALAWRHMSVITSQITIKPVVQQSMPDLKTVKQILGFQLYIHHFYNFFRPTTKETSKFTITGPLWRESPCDRWIPLTKDQ